jgi:UDP-N-acetylmuramate--alanine ligase
MSVLANIKSVYLIGIGGIGMSALARFFAQRRLVVAGYDRTPSALTESLQSEGIAVSFKDGMQEVPSAFTKKEETLVIYTPAIPAAHQQLNHFRDNGFLLKKRAEVLGMLSEGHRTLAVAGTHGKTTTSSILAHLLRSSSLDCNAFLGGISADYGTNFLSSTTSDLLVAEADEYDRSFLTAVAQLGHHHFGGCRPSGHLWHGR